MTRRMRKKGKNWCRAELIVVHQCSGNMRVKQIGLLIGRSESAVRTKAREVGINLRLRGRFHQSVKYPEADVELARELHAGGVKLRDIAEKLELPLGMVKRYVYLERRT